MATLCQLSYHGILFYAKLFGIVFVQFVKLRTYLLYVPLAQFIR